MNASGFGAFVLHADYATASGGFFTATATSATDNTSAFSGAIQIAGNANTIFVASIYGLFFGRTPEVAANAWVDALNNGATPESVVFAIENGTEYLSNQVAAMYERYLNRPADAAELQGWVSFVRMGHTLEQVGEGIVSSVEYFQLHGGTNRGYVIGLYTDVLGRPASDAEVDYWVARLNAGQTRASVATSFFNSTEYRTNLVVADYETYLGRAPEPAGLAGWLDHLANGLTDLQLLAQIFGSGEGYAKWS
jgi:hypothetical protein